MAAARFRRFGTRICCLLLLVAALALAPLPRGHATDGRDFAGFYSVSNVADLGEAVRLTLSTRVVNYSDADVNNATVTLSGNVSPDQDFGCFANVSVADRQETRLTAEFTIPKDEYTFWQAGGNPAMRIDYQSAAGDSVRRKIELVPTAGEEQ